jgi:hypothetical protein
VLQQPARHESVGRQRLLAAMTGEEWATQQCVISPSEFCWALAGLRTVGEQRGNRGPSQSKQATRLVALALWLSQIQPVVELPAADSETWTLAADSIIVAVRVSSARAGPVIARQTRRHVRCGTGRPCLSPFSDRAGVSCITWALKL